MINGCDSFPDGVWRHCCDAHDVAYTLGGDVWAKVASDLELGWCVASSLPGPGIVVGGAMTAGVLAFGWLFYRYRGLRGPNISEIVLAKESSMVYATKDVLSSIRSIATAKKWPESHLGAVVMAESGGTFWVDVNGERKVPMLYEPHVAYRITTGAVRQQLLDAGLASPKWNKKLYAKTVAGRWKQLQRAVSIGGDALFAAASYGVGQVLGENWKSLGYLSIGDFVKRVTASEKGQIDAMVRYIETNHLDDELVEGRWDAFARGYNGPGYKKNRYAEKMAQFAAQWGGKVAVSDGMLRMGAKGARVRELQVLLKRANVYSGVVDGDFGPATKTAVRDLQTQHNIKVDGVVGPETQRVLQEFRQSREENLAKQDITRVDEVQDAATLGGTTTVGGIVAKEALEKARDQLSPFSGTGGVIDVIVTVLTVAIVLVVVGSLGYAAWGWWKSKKTVEV